MTILEKLREVTKQSIPLSSIYALAFSTTEVKPAAEYVWGVSICPIDKGKVSSFFFGWPPESSMKYDNVPDWDINANCTLLDMADRMKTMLMRNGELPEKLYFVGSMATTWLKPIMDELKEEPGFSWLPKFEVIDINQLASAAQHPALNVFTEDYIIGRALPKCLFPARFGINKLAALFNIAPANGKLPEWKAHTIAKVAKDSFEKEVKEKEEDA